MLRGLAAFAICLTLYGCSLQNSGPSNLQFERTAIPFPDNYQSEAAWAVQRRGGDPGIAMVSRPQPMIGRSAFGPQRWFSCISGVAPRQAERDRLPRLADMLDPEAHRGAGPRPHYLLLIFHGAARPDLKDGFDIPLCRALTYEPIGAEAPMI
ncbi:hypothetical protein O9Z70_01410 [Devosia sp. YIM 151766]|uniref:hypothetical protein n=1 Tax=Devosia sp. YIM 151766 TaxID=3017325 RepID=UPI00255CE66F|nr:hypothetical protein [Devosia sp. YIM 151766]WIY53229.1 hypothetical protein O9Z70_01410 [Devosia sp. YIM 151766]